MVVDYAHTDDALRNLDRAGPRIRGRAADEGPESYALWLRRRSRSRQASADGRGRGRGSDFVVLTSDNPRSEDPLAIINDALVGLQRTGAKYMHEPDRRKAIALAICEARPGDMVLLAGKGHEKVQTTKEGSIPFDDVDVTRESLKALGYDCARFVKAEIAGVTA